MSNSSVVTAFRDALRRNPMGVNKEDYVRQINESSLTKTQKTLCLVELDLVGWEFVYEGYSEEDILEAKRQLTALKEQKKQADSTYSKKWGIETASRLAFDTLQSLSPLRLTSSSPDEIKLENLTQKVDKLLKKIQKERLQAYQSVFDKILDTVNDEAFIDLTNFMRHLIAFRQLCVKYNKHTGNYEEGGSEDWVKMLNKHFALLENEDLMKIYERMRSDEMISLINAFYTQRHIHMYEEEGLEEEDAFEDALSIWPMNLGWMKANVIESISTKATSKSLSMMPTDYAKRAFTSTAAQFYITVRNVYDSLCDEMERRNLRGYAPVLMSASENSAKILPHTLYLEAKDGQLFYQTDLSHGIFSITQQDCLALGIRENIIHEFFLAINRVAEDPSSLSLNMHHYLEDIVLKITTQRGHTVPTEHTPFISEWPTDETGKYKKIVISPAEKHLIGECVKANNPIHLDRRAPIPKMQPKQYVLQEKIEAYHFGGMIHSLGVFFNPNRFCDLLLKIDSESIQSSLSNCSKAQLRSLYKKLQGTELNNLVALLKEIKDGEAEKRKEVYQWLSIKNPGVVDERFQEVAEQLYYAADTLMQAVREKLQAPKDYAYNNVQLKEDRIYTPKNQACVKRLLEIYAGALPNRDFSYNMWDYLYSFFHRGEKTEGNLSEGFGNSLMDPLSLGDPLNEENRTAPNTPAGTPTYAQKQNKNLSTILGLL